MEKAKKYIKENRQRFLDELFELIRIPSISSDSTHKDDMVKTAEKIKSFLLAAGADKAQVMPSEGNPVVFAEKIIDPALYLVT
jgi:acetylornithine deacetylase/succinyl-diaminopimelate desuccinylase-like protein